MPVPKSTPILILGSGPFGLSTALHLISSGYTTITVLDRSPTIPSPHSAANDINKILRAEYESPFYTSLSIAALREWQSPLFAPHFHRTGFLHCVSGDAPRRARETLGRFRKAAEDDPLLQKFVVGIDGPEDVRNESAWQFTGRMDGWTGYLNRFDGYCHSSNALVAVHKECERLGVRFILGTAGNVVEILPDGSVRTVDGTVHRSGLTIVAVGAAAAKLVPQVGRQVVAKSWSVAHVKLTDDEASLLRGMPVTYARDFGFMFEPEPGTNLLKICPMGGGYVNTDPATGVSHAPAEWGDFMPAEDEKRCRKLLEHTLPWLADRPLINKQLCWFADTADSDFVIDWVPGREGRVVLCSGDSGHGMKMFPSFGRWVRGLVESEDGKQPVECWRWKERPEEEEGGKEDWGGKVSWRLGETREFEEVRPVGRVKL